MNKKRIRKLNNSKLKKGKVLYWMSRDQRVDDNWALIYSQELSTEVIVVFNLVNTFLDASKRHYDFMIKGLKKIEKRLKNLNIQFVLLIGDPKKNIPLFIKENDIKALITDFSPLKIKREWNKEILKKINIPFFEVDAHNIIPCWVTSQKQEYGAYTIRPKIHKLLPEFLDEFPLIKKQKKNNKNSFENNNSNEIDSNINNNIDSEIDNNGGNKIFNKLRKIFFDKESTISWINSGEDEAKKMLKYFIKHKLHYYDQERNNPNNNHQSNLSPYIHFGQISAQRIAIEVKKENEILAQTFLEQLIVRRELSENYCYYNKNYDNYEGIHEWAKKSLEEHKNDLREYVYSLKEFENAKTHDRLWNAAQLEMVKKGKMHGYLRMYWAKKILEWSQTPKEAYKIAIYLNDKYSLDGRDPNGYVGIAWSIGGTHDRPWFERKVFGKIRFMALSGMMKKFNVKEYIESNF